MNHKDFTAVLQVALWKNDGMNELEIRQLLSNLCSRGTISAGMQLHTFLHSIQFKREDKPHKI